MRGRKIDWERIAEEQGFEDVREMFVKLMQKYRSIWGVGLALEQDEGNVRAEMRRLRLRAPARDFVAWKYGFGSMKELLRRKLAEGKDIPIIEE